MSGGTPYSVLRTCPAGRQALQQVCNPISSPPNPAHQHFFLLSSPWVAGSGSFVARLVPPLRVWLDAKVPCRQSHQKPYSPEDRPTTRRPGSLEQWQERGPTGWPAPGEQPCRITSQIQHLPALGHCRGLATALPERLKMLLALGWTTADISSSRCSL